jgi:type I restriction enzyme, S subunit
MMKAYPEYKETKVEWVGKLPSHWKVMPLKYAALVNREALTEQVEEDFELQYIDIGNVNQLGLVNAPERMKFINAPSRARRIIKKNDTIISTVRTYLKTVAFIDRDDNNLIASTGFATLTSLNETHPKYLYYLVSNQGFVDTVSACSTGVSYPAITSTELARITAWLPSLPEQQAIADFLDRKTAQIDTLIEKKQRQIDLLQEQRTALINHAVTKGLNPDVRMKDSGVEWLGEIPSHWEALMGQLLNKLMAKQTFLYQELKLFQLEK